MFVKIGLWNQLIRQVAERYGGSARPGGLFSNPSLHMPYGQHYCHLKFRKRNWGQTKKRSTEFTTNWPDRSLGLSIISVDPSLQLIHPRKLVQIQVRDTPFDKFFEIYGFPIEKTHKLLNPQVRWQFEELAKLNGDGKLYVTISSGFLTITKPGYIRDQINLIEFLRLSLALLDQFSLTCVDGIEFEESSSAKLLEQVICPICNEEIIEQMVVCLRCKTPHCRDCWEYNGQCAMFACGEQRFLNTASRQTN